MDQQQFKDPCFYVPGESGIIDIAVMTERGYVGQYSRETLEEIGKRRPGVQLGEWDVVYKAMLESHLSQPEEITEEKFWYYLEVLPPMGWVRRKDSESFKMCERLIGNVTQIVARIGTRYFAWADYENLGHDYYMGKILLAFPELAI